MDEKKIESWRDEENIDKNPNALTYGISPSAPASIHPVDIEKWKNEVKPTFKHYFTERYNELVKQYEQLVKDYHINKMLYESEIKFEPIIGQTYYLYKRASGSTFITIVAPGQAFWGGYIGAFKFNAQYAWEEVL